MEDDIEFERWVYVPWKGFKLIDGAFIIDGKFVVITAEEQIEMMTPERRAFLGF